MEKYSKAKIKQLKEYDKNDDWETIELLKSLSQLKGCFIENIGFINECREGGLTIDYDNRGSRNRIVIGFNELGAWKEWSGKNGIHI